MDYKFAITGKTFEARKNYVHALVDESALLREKSCSQLRSLLLEEKNLRTSTDDIFLLRFLRATKFNVSKAHSMILKYYAVKQRSPEMCVPPRPSEVIHLLRMGMQSFLEDRTRAGYRVGIFRLDKVDFSLIGLDEIFLTNVMCAEAVSLEPETQKTGVVCIIDLNEFSLHQHTCLFSPHYSSRTFELVQGAFPLRFKEFHVINEPFYFGAFYSLLKPFLKEKIRKRVFFHGHNLKSLHKYVDPMILPKEYGGVKEELDDTAWREKLLELDDWFAELKTYGFDKS